MTPESVKVKRNGLHNLNIELRYLKENNYPIPPYLPTPSRPSPPPSTTHPASLYKLEPGRFRLHKKIAAPTVLRPHPTPTPPLQFSIPDATICMENYTQPPTISCSKRPTIFSGERAAYYGEPGTTFMRQNKTITAEETCSGLSRIYE